MRVPHDRLVEGPTPREIVAGGGLVVWVFWVIAFVSASTTIALSIPQSISILRAPAGRQRRHTLIITALPVLFAVTSTVACVFNRATLVMECMQHVAEAFALHSLMKLIIARMGGPVRATEHLKAQGPHRYLQVPPFCCVFFCLPKIVFGHRVVRLIRMTTRQFMILVPIFTFLLVIVGYCRPSEHPLLISALRIGMFLSALTALYGLFVMWSATRIELLHYRTTAKYAVIKLIILISLVQRCVLMLLASNGVIRGDRLYTPSAKATLYQNVLVSSESPICCAMVLYAYPSSELRDDGDGLRSFGPDETATEDLEPICEENIKSWPGSFGHSYVIILSERRRFQAMDAPRMCSVGICAEDCAKDKECQQMKLHVNGRMQQPNVSLPFLYPP